MASESVLGPLGPLAASMLLMLAGGATKDDLGTLADAPLRDGLNIPYQYELVGYVWRVLDGDTIDVKTSNGVVRVRLADIDAPEKDQPGGAASLLALSVWINGRPVVVRVKSIGRYGRVVGHVFDDSGRWVNQRMVCLGFAWAAPLRYSPSLDVAECEAFARRHRTGIWALRVKHVEPWKWRHQKRKEDRR